MLLGHAGPGVEQLIAAAPHDHRRVSTQPPHNVGSLVFQHRQIMILVGIFVTGKRKFLPHHNTQFIADIKEGLFVHITAAPNAEDIHVAIHSLLHKTAVVIFIHIAGEKHSIDPVGTLGKYANTINLQSCRGIGTGLGITDHRPTTFVHHQFGPAETDLSAFAFLSCRNSNTVKWLLTISNRIPKLRIFDRKFKNSTLIFCESLGRDNSLSTLGNGQNKACFSCCMGIYTHEACFKIIT